MKHMETDSPYSPPAEICDGISPAELESKKTFWKRAAWISGALSAIVPLLGLIGTILAMRKAFSAIGGNGVADPRTLSEAIGEALISTAIGLTFTIPILVFFIISLVRVRSYRARIRRLSA